MNSGIPPSRSILTRCRRPAVGWLQLLIILFWTVSPAMRTDAVYAPDDTGMTPSYWVPMWIGDTQPANGPDAGDMDGNGVADWYDEFQYAKNNAGTLAWWGGGSYYVDGVARTFAAQWCVCSPWAS